MAAAKKKKNASRPKPRGPSTEQVIFAELDSLPREEQREMVALIAQWADEQDISWP